MCKKFSRKIILLIDLYGADTIRRQVYLIEAERARRKLRQVRRNENPNPRRQHGASGAVP